MPRQDLQWLVLDDFSAGIQNKVMRTGIQSASQRLGAATEENTYRCIALPTGGLGPLPRRSYNILADDYPIFPNVAVPEIWVSGAYLTGPILDLVGDPGPSSSALYLAVEYFETVGADVRRRWYLHQVGLWDDPPQITQIDSYTPATPRASAQVRVTSIADYRTQTDEANESIAGVPVVVYAWYPEGGSAGDGEDRWRMYPDPADPGNFGLYDINAEEWPGAPLDYKSLDKLIGHQGRYIGFDQQFFFHGSLTATWSSDEQIYFSRVNLPILHSRESAAFGYEKMTGFGTAFSTSSDELFLVKHRGGGLTVNGDLENPAIVWLPGVTSTGGISTQACYSPIGAIYAVKGGGVYAWQGGDNSIKISQVLEDNFFLIDEDDQETMNGFRGQFAFWDDWIITPNNWVFDLLSQSWWRLEDPSLYTFCFAQRDIVYNNLFTLPFSYNSTSDVLVGGFQKSEPAHDYSWQSQPVPQTMDQVWEVREVVLTAQGAGSVIVTLLDQDGVDQEFDFTITNANSPQSLRVTYSLTVRHLQVRIESFGTDIDPSAPAPIVYEVKLGWRPHTHIPSSGVGEEP